MTIARVRATGKGAIAWRLSIEGFPFEFVSNRYMAGVAADGRERVNAIRSDGLRLAQKANLVKATLDASPASFTLVDVGKRVTEAFSTDPTNITWLTAELSASATSMSVKSTEGFASSGAVYLDSERIEYTGKTATTFTGLTRGTWQTLAAVHYVPGEGFLRYPEVTNLPTLLEGRRVRLYAYGKGDDQQGDGEQWWLGVIQGEPRMRGSEWTIGADPISRVLDAELGSDLGEPATVRGIYLGGSSFRWVLRIGRIANTGGASETVPVTDYSAGSVVFPNTTDGAFFETQEDFVAAVNRQLAVIHASWATKIYCVVDPNGYHFEIDAGALPDGINMRLDAPECEPVFEGATITADAERAGTPVYTMSEGRYYVWPTSWPMAGSGQVPRGIFRGITGAYDASLASWPPDRLHLGGIIGITSNTTAAKVDWPDDGERVYSVETLDVSNRTIDLSRRFGGHFGPDTRTADTHVYAPGALPSIRLGRSFTTTVGAGVWDLLTGLAATAPAQVNLGTQPMIREPTAGGSFLDGDFNADAFAEAYAGAPAVAASRYYEAFEPIKLSDLICPDLQLLGYYLAIDAQGRLTTKPLRLASQTEVASFALTKSNLITGDEFPSYEKGAVGVYNTLLVRDGYNVLEDRYESPSLHVRDVASYGRSPIARTVMVEPKSWSRVALTPADAVRIANGVLGIFGHPYAYIQCVVPLTALLTTTLGSTVSITTKHLPSSAGLRGVTDLVALVLAREIEPMAAKITLTLLASRMRIAGYAPGAKVSSQTGATDLWDITLSSAYFETSDTAADHLEAGDRVIVFRYDSLTAGTIAGEVLAVAANVVTVQFDASWTPSTDEWFLQAAPADDAALQTGQERYAYLADATGLIDFASGAEAARALAP